MVFASRKSRYSPGAVAAVKAAARAAGAGALARQVKA